jgi:N-acetyltransferase
METPTFSEDYFLENEIVRLRPLNQKDVNSLSVFSINEPELWKYSLTPADGLENLKKYIEIALKGREDKTSYPFVVFDKRTNQYAGSTRFYDFQSHHKTTQLGYTWYGKEFQGTGLNKNCKFLMLQFAFEKLGLERVEFRADAKNEQSIAAMKSIGCTVEGILRQNCEGLSGRRDSIVLSILKSEWFNTIKTNLSEKIQ